MKTSCQLIQRRIRWINKKENSFRQNWRATGLTWEREQRGSGRGLRRALNPDLQRRRRCLTHRDNCGVVNISVSHVPRSPVSACGQRSLALAPRRELAFPENSPPAESRSPMVQFHNEMHVHHRHTADTNWHAVTVQRYRNNLML